MGIMIGNGVDDISINSFNFNRMNENWILGQVKLKRELLEYRCPINFQPTDFEIFSVAIAELIEGDKNIAEFNCLEEGLRIQLTKVDTLGHFNLKAVINNIDTGTKIEINFEMLLSDLMELRSQINCFFKRFVENDHRNSNQMNYGSD